MYLVTVDTKNAEFMDHNDIWQNFLDKEETNKTNSATVLNQLQLSKRQFWQGDIANTTDHKLKKPTTPKDQKD